MDLDTRAAFFVPQEPSARVNENKNNVYKYDAENACPQTEACPEHTANDAYQKAYSFFAADEP
ncbi:MAG TPA: hypothetical protein PKH33_18560 [bacterium]|nr:hypothetical protein [bacterium]